MMLTRSFAAPWIGLLMAVLLTTARAEGQPQREPWAERPHACSAYLTEAECKTHLRILSLLNDPRERMAYMAMHTQLIQEREALCGVPAGRRLRHLVSLNLEGR